MLIKNNAARLITFSWMGVKYRFMPAGKATEVPDEAAASDFLKSLKADGSISVQSGESGDGLLDDIDELAPLRVEAEGLDIKVDKRWGEERLRKEIDDALAGNQE